MKLQVGERLSGSGPVRQPGGYVVTEVLSETPWHGLYAGKKILYNFDFSSKRVRETDENEWLDVLLRTIHYPTLDDPEYVTQRRSLARAEVRSVLGRGSSNLLPEPIDLLELVNTRDAFGFPQAVGDLEPIVINARLHGQLLSEWQQTARPVAATLAVLAELLSFIEKAHQEGFLLNGMGPSSILIDQAQRVHYVGTEMMIQSSSPFASSANGWARIFPAERFPRGFSPPECFPGGSGSDRRSDLYAWGSLAYCLLTGQMPWQIALDQGRSWAHFQETHFTALENALRDVPKAHLAGWLEQLGLGDTARSVVWPGGFVGLMRRLLHPDPRRRPTSVDELRRWLVSPPPPLVAAILALRTSPTDARVFIDSTGLDPQLQIVVRRGIGQAPAGPTDGSLIFEGTWPVSAGKTDSKAGKAIHDRQVPESEKPIRYAAFTRRQDGKETVVSQAVVAELMQPTPANLLRLAEAESFQLKSKDEVPAAVRLCFQTLDPAVVAEALFESSMPIVRSWALRQLHKLRKTGLPETALEALLWRGVCDSAPSLRRESAREILARFEPTEDLLERLAWTMGRDNPEEALQATQVLRSLGVADDLIRHVADRLGEDRSQACPVCEEKIASRDRAAHLRKVHGYAEVDDSLFPQPQALARLWEKVLQEGSQAAHERLLLVAGERKGEWEKGRKGEGEKGRGAEADEGRTSESDVEEISGAASLSPFLPFSPSSSHPYVASLEEALQAQAVPLEKLIQCLRQSHNVLPLLPQLLKAQDKRLPEVAREVLLPRLGETLRSESATPQDVRRALEQACPGADLLEERILLCHRLPQVGVAESTAAACGAQLQEERLVPCSECRASVPVRDLEAHLLAEHRIYQFRGVRRDRQAMKDSVLDALCQASADVPAGRMLETLAREHGDKANRRLVTWLCQRLRKVPRLERLAAVAGVAETLTAMRIGEKLLPLLLTPFKWAAGQWLSRCLALEIVARQTGAVADDVVRSMKPLLADRLFPPLSRQRALVGLLLRTTGKEGPAALDLFMFYLARTSKMRSLEKLRELERLIGKSATLDSLYSDTVDQVRMTCPRCGKQLRRKLMVTHLWERHRLVLDGLKAREPWRLIEDWVVDYRVEKNPDLYHLCRDLAFQLDGDQGLFQLQQLMLQHGVDDPDAHKAVFDRARKQQATVCPKCYRLLPTPALLRSSPPNFEGNEMDGAGYRLEVFEKGPVPWLTVDTADETIYNGREPGRMLTRQGALMFLVIPISLVVFAIMRLAIGSELHALAILALSVVFGLGLSGVAYAFWPQPRPVQDRLIDAAWGVLVPRLFEGTLSHKDAAFVGGLAQVTPGLGMASWRAGVLEECLTQLEQANDPRYVPIEAALLRVQAEDARLYGEDPLPILLKPLRACLVGKKNFALADGILAELHAAGDAGSSLRARVKLLMVEAMFAAGLELNDLPDLAQAYPGLGDTLDIKNVDVLISLRYLFSLKASKPWEKHGKAMTVYDMAAEFEQTDALLGRYPGLLLSAIGHPIFLTIRGLWCEDLCILEQPRSLEVRKLPPREGYQLILGKEHLWFATSPEELAASLEQWLGFFFTELMPGLKQFSTKRHGDGMKRLAAKNALVCPGCACRLLPRMGARGVVGEW